MSAKPMTWKILERASVLVMASLNGLPSIS